MQKYCFLLISIAVSTTAWSQSNTFPASGNVGIGTTSPSANLHVSNSSTSTWIAIDKLANYEGGLQFRRLNNILFYVYSDNTDNDALKIQATGLTGEGDGAPRIHIPYNNKNLYLAQSGGNVAIGHGNPYSESGLHIKSPTVSQWGFVTEANANQRLVGVGHNGTAGFISVSYLGGAGYSPLLFRTSELTRMTLDVNGNLGVGQTTPLAKVHISEGDLLLQNSTSGYPRILLKDVSGTNSLKLDYNSVIGAGGKMYIQTSDSQPVVLNATSGNVGIGTSSPDQRLTVKGKVHAEEVIIDLSVPAPDYVFEKSYDLRPLDEVKTFIDENKHLPEVPSAKEMEKDGVSVGEMEMILLKKIEELTLYMIELKQENSEMKKEIEHIKSSAKN
ncbi:MAG TPA: hypothetical protein VGD65_25745 [Chryseosolibacter sp.]